MFPRLQYDFEIRRLLLGLTSVLNSAYLPAVVESRLADVVAWVVALSGKDREKREKRLADDEKEVEDDGFEDDGSED